MHSPTFALKCAFCIMHVAKYALPKLLAYVDLQVGHQFKVKVDRKKTTSVFGFCLTAGENVDFYNYPIFG